MSEHERHGTAHEEAQATEHKSHKPTLEERVTTLEQAMAHLTLVVTAMAERSR